MPITWRQQWTGPQEFRNKIPLNVKRQDQHIIGQSGVWKEWNKRIVAGPATVDHNITIVTAIGILFQSKWGSEEKRIIQTNAGNP